MDARPRASMHDNFYENTLASQVMVFAWVFHFFYHR